MPAIVLLLLGSILTVLDAWARAWGISFGGEMSIADLIATAPGIEAGEFLRGQVLLGFCVAGLAFCALSKPRWIRIVALCAIALLLMVNADDLPFMLFAPLLAAIELAQGSISGESIHEDWFLNAAYGFWMYGVLILCIREIVYLRLHRDEAKCPACGFWLMGLKDDGCPECGWGRS
jgi:hypothetical protein